MDSWLIVFGKVEPFFIGQCNGVTGIAYRFFCNMGLIRILWMNLDSVRFTKRPQMG